MSRIAILENYTLYCSGISPVLKTIPEFTIIAEAKSPNELLQKINGDKADVIIVDVIHCEKEGIAPLKKIRRKYRKTPVLLVISNDYSAYLEEYISLGVTGIIFNNSTSEDLIEAVKSLSRNEDFFPQRVWSLLKNFFRKKNKEPLSEINEQQLSSREISILKLFCKGHSYKEIGDILNISPRTVETHKRNIQTKNGVNSTAEMVEYAFQNKLS